MKKGIQIQCGHFRGLGPCLIHFLGVDEAIFKAICEYFRTSLLHGASGGVQLMKSNKPSMQIIKMQIHKV